MASQARGRARTRERGHSYGQVVTPTGVDATSDPLPVFQPIQYGGPSPDPQVCAPENPSIDTRAGFNQWIAPQISPLYHSLYHSYSGDGSTSVSTYPGAHASQVTPGPVFPHTYLAQADGSPVSVTAGIYAGAYPGHPSQAALVPQVLPPSQSSFSSAFGQQGIPEEAAFMTRVSGPEADVVASQPRRLASRGPSQDRLRAPAPYTIPSRHASPSASLSRTPSAWSSVDGDSAPKRRDNPGTRKNDLGPTSLEWYPHNIQKVLVLARRTLVNDMLTTLGWLYGKKTRTAYEGAIGEAVGQAKFALNEHVELTHDMQTVILKAPTLVRSKAVEYAEVYAEKFFVTDNTELLADSVGYQKWKTTQLDLMKDHRKLSFFFHAHNDKGEVERWFGNSILEDFHCNFWYTTNTSPVQHFSATYRDHTTPTRMYALSATALLCACDRVALGRKHKSGNALQFSGADYGPIFDAYHDALLEYSKHPDFKTEFNLRLKWLNSEGLRRMDMAIPRKKVDPVYVPPPRQVESDTNVDPVYVPPPQQVESANVDSLMDSNTHMLPGPHNPQPESDLYCGQPVYYGFGHLSQVPESEGWGGGSSESQLPYDF